MRNPSILLLQQGQLLETVAHFRALARKVKTRRPPDAQTIDELNDVLFMLQSFPLSRPHIVLLAGVEGKWP